MLKWSQKRGQSSYEKWLKLFFIHGENPSFCSVFHDICHSLKRTRASTIAEGVSVESNDLGIFMLE